jgi:hypothetical protein
MNKYVGASIVFLLPFIVQASNYNWLEDAPISKFTEQDWELAKSNAKKLLDLGKQGEMTEWTNSENGHGGTYKLLRSRESGTQTCHALLIEHHAMDLKNESQHEFCKQLDGTWKRP